MIDQGKLTQLYTDVEVLKHEVTALRHIATILATRLCELDPESAARTQSLLAALIPYAEYAEQPACGGTVKAFLQGVLALTDNGVDPASVLALRALMAKDAGPDRLDALDAWHAQASDEELAQDAQQLLEKVLRQRGENPGGSSSDSE
jgi:hypothetical protein